MPIDPATLARLRAAEEELRNTSGALATWMERAWAAEEKATALEALVPLVEKLLGSINADQSQLDTSSAFERNYIAVGHALEVIKEGS